MPPPNEGLLMKVGDLVELSASARRLNWAQRFRDKVGIVISMKYEDFIMVRWCGSKYQSPFMKEMFTRPNLRHAKIRKNE